jgi:methyl-accepting chemotaxis protein
LELQEKQAPLFTRIKDLAVQAEHLLENASNLIKKEGDGQIALVDNSQTIGYAVSIGAVLLGIIAGVILSRNITTGMRRAVETMSTIAEDGNVAFEVSEEDLNRRDEVGDLAHAVSGILEQFQHVERLASNLANGNYNVTTTVRSEQDSMNIYLNKMLDQTNYTLHEISDSVRQVATGSSEVTNAAQSLSTGAQTAAASLEEITASMSEISSQTKANAESAGQARDLANTASEAAAEGQQAMKEMTSAMERITHNSSEIQRVIKVIDDIAFQTNLLALNAAVEAARAGQHGKGFAVVAEEVRNLASRSAKAARETSELIAKSGSEIEKGGEVASHTAGVLDTIVAQIKQTTSLVSGIAVASNEQAQGVNQVTIGLQQIDSVTQQNTAAAEESASAASEMSSMATNLQKLVGQFRLRGQSGGSRATVQAAPCPPPTPEHALPAKQRYSTPSRRRERKPTPTPSRGSRLVSKSAATKPLPAARHAAGHDSEYTHPSEPVSDMQWGNGADEQGGFHIDLSDKGFGKY